VHAKDEKLGKNHHDRKEFERVYKQYAPGLIFHARKFVDHPTAEDVVHDVFLKIWNSGTVMVANESIGSYLFTAVRNACLDLLKHQSVCNDYQTKAIRDLQIEELSFNENVLNKLIDQERIDAVYRQIDQLPEKCREVFVLAYIEEKKNAEIAELLQISVRTVEAQIYKALKMLRKAFQVSGFVKIRANSWTST